MGAAPAKRTEKRRACFGTQDGNWTARAMPKPIGVSLRAVQRLWTSIVSGGIASGASDAATIPVSRRRQETSSALYGPVLTRRRRLHR